MKKTMIAALLLLGMHAHAAMACSNGLALSGTERLTTCVATDPNCIPAPQALFEHANKIPGSDDPDKLVISVHASPWRLYDHELRIMDIQELADTIRANSTPAIQKIILAASWTGTAVQGKPSIADQLSKVLGGTSVRGMDGFMWINPQGVIRTSKNQYTVKIGQGPYMVPANQEVMASMAIGWPFEQEAHFIKTKNPQGLLAASVGWDVLMLCPDHALASFEKAAAMGNPIAAYNAAWMHLQPPASPGSTAKAKALLTQAAAAGDAKSKNKLLTLTAH